MASQSKGVLRQERVEPEDSADSKQALSSSELGDDSDVPCVKKCRKHKNQTECEKTKCLKTTTEAVSETPSQDTSDTTSSSESSNGKKQTKRLKTSKARSPATTDTESSKATDEATTSASTPPAESSSEIEAQSSGDEDAVTTGDELTGWTLSEDYLLRGMKEDGRQPTWVEISKVLNRSKKGVQGRWKIIKDRAHCRDTVEEDENDTAEKKKNKNKKKQEKTGTKTEHNELPTTKDTSKWHKGEHNTRVIAENKIAKSRAAPKTAAAAADTATIFSGEEPSSDTDADADADSDSDSDHDDLGYGPCDERRRQARYLHRHVYAELYPPTISPVPDAYFGPRDCEVLAAVESRYQRGKWLEMQANFYNVTGRMVPLDLIRKKCERAEAEEAARQRGRRSKRGSGEDGDGGTEGRTRVRVG